MNTKIRHAITQLLPSIIALAQPQRVILFGSAASGRTGPDSDLDFLVIIPDGKKPAAVTNRLNMEIRNKPMPCDFIVTTPAAILKNKAKPGGIYQTALAEGKELYAAH
jgi:predicted nucleotidyltransferase